jgi:hypothetical protein
MARWAYRWNQNRNLKSPFRCVSVSFEVYALRVGKRRCAGATGFRDGVYLQCNSNHKDKMPGARFAPRVPQSLASHWPHDYVVTGCEGHTLN